MFLYCWWDGEGKLGMVQKNNTRGIFKGIKLFKTIFFIISSLRVLYCVQQLGHFFPFLCEGFQPIPRIRFDLGVLCPDWTLSTGVNGWWFSFWCGLCGSSQANALTHSFIHILLFCSVLFPFLGFCLFNIFFRLFSPWIRCSVFHPKWLSDLLNWIYYPQNIHSFILWSEAELTKLLHNCFFVSNIPIDVPQHYSDTCLSPFLLPV